MADQFSQMNQPSTWPPSGGAGSCRVDFSQTSSPSSLNSDQIKNAIQAKYAEVSVTAAGKFSYPTGIEGARALGYDPIVLHSAPASLMVSFCGVGNPFSLGSIRHGETVLDYGCGCGFDLFVASSLVGQKGRVFGIDLTEDMVRRARESLTRADIRNFEVTQVGFESMPYANNSFDVVISNGVINLAPDKASVFQDIHRVLKPGGRLQFADVMLEKSLPAHMSGSAEAWSQWIGGAIPVGDQTMLLQKAGFAEVEFRGFTGFRTSEYTVGALFRALRKWHNSIGFAFSPLHSIPLSSTSLVFLVIISTNSSWRQILFSVQAQNERGE